MLMILGILKIQDSRLKNLKQQRAITQIPSNDRKGTLPPPTLSLMS